MNELTWILDSTTGDLTLEGMRSQEALAFVSELLPRPREVNCARPLASVPLPLPAAITGPFLNVARIYHGSVVDGPGRRSVCQLQGCLRDCPGCFVPSTHDRHSGHVLAVAQVVDLLLAPQGEPREGVTITGGEPFLQPAGLLVLLRELKSRNLHTVVYTGYTLEALTQRPEPEVRQALALIDLLIDGPFIAALAAGTGESRGSRNQRLIASPATAIAADGLLASCQGRPGTPEAIR
jgi:anaerobic ribonucleoside-triphosphate reductase activating protein